MALNTALVLSLVLLVFIIPSTTRTEAFLVVSSKAALLVPQQQQQQQQQQSLTILCRQLQLSSSSSSSSSNNSSNNSNSNPLKIVDENFDLAHGSANEAWEQSPAVLSRPYVSPMVKEMNASSQSTFLTSLDLTDADPLWEQIKLEAQQTLLDEPEAGPQVYTRILSQRSLLHALTSIVSHDIETELMPATSLQNLFFETLHPIHDFKNIALDVMASAMRTPSSTFTDEGVVVDRTALLTVLFHQGLHALVCHRLSHRLWCTGRKSLACYIQSTLSRRYSADIHPAARLGPGTYLNAGSAGVVIGETAVVEQDVSILQGVTLGGTGKERGDRHPKIGRGALLQHSCSVLGNIRVGEGAIVTAKSIVTKDVPMFARVSGVPAKVKSYRQGGEDGEEGAGGIEGAGGYGRGTFGDGQQLSELEVQMRNRYLRFWNDDRLLPADDLMNQI